MFLSVKKSYFGTHIYIKTCIQQSVLQSVCVFLFMGMLMFIKHPCVSVCVFLCTATEHSGNWVYPCNAPVRHQMALWCSIRPMLAVLIVWSFALSAVCAARARRQLMQILFPFFHACSVCTVMLIKRQVQIQPKLSSAKAASECVMLGQPVSSSNQREHRLRGRQEGE